MRRSCDVCAGHVTFFKSGKSDSSFKLLITARKNKKNDHAFTKQLFVSSYRCTSEGKNDLI